MQGMQSCVIIRIDKLDLLILLPLYNIRTEICNIDRDSQVGIMLHLRFLQDPIFHALRSERLNLFNQFAYIFDPS